MNKSTKNGGKQSTKIVFIIVGSLFVAGLCCVGSLAGLLLPAIQQARNAATRTAVMNGMKEIALNLHTVAGKNGIPPLYNASGTGPAEIPWRIAILEADLARRQVFSSFDKSQKWDSASNKSATTNRPHYFAVNYYGTTPLGPRETHIFRVKLSASEQPKNFRDITDGTGNTVAFVYLPKKTCDWASDVDATPNEIFQSIQDSTTVQPVIFGFYDGSIRSITPTLSRSDFDAMMTPTGGEVVNSASIF